MDKVTLLKSAGTEDGSKTLPTVQRIVCECGNEEFRFTLAAREAYVGYVISCTQCRRVQFVAQTTPFIGPCLGGPDIRIPPYDVFMEKFIEDVTGIRVEGG